MSDEKSIQAAILKEDAFGTAKNTSLEELQRLKAAEELFQLRHQRTKRSSKFLTFSQVLVGYIALAGFFANAYQNCVNERRQNVQTERDQDRWRQEFRRAQEADKHRAFFETSLLATDKDNDDKRLVGYALLQEFVADPDFNFKATLMLEESLAQELKQNSVDVGLSDSVRVKVVAIVTALSQTHDCERLQRAALTIDRVAQHHVKRQDTVETGAVFEVYVRRLVGRAAEVCTDLRGLQAVRRPMRDTLMRIPGIGDLEGPIDIQTANLRIAEILRKKCDIEVDASGASDCKSIYSGYAKLCDSGMRGSVHQSPTSRDGGVTKPADREHMKHEAASCELIATALEQLNSRQDKLAPDSDE